MARVRTFSTTFPSYHPKAGEPTFFVEKIWESLLDIGAISMSKCCELSRQTGIGGYNMNNVRDRRFFPKHHTVRAGHHFKPGDVFSPRIWSGKPYRSEQIIIAPDIDVMITWDFEIKYTKIYGCQVLVNADDMGVDLVGLLAKNDGLNYLDFLSWFKYEKKEPFIGQVISWSDKIEY